MSMLEALQSHISKPLSPFGEAVINAYEAAGVSGNLQARFSRLTFYRILAQGWPLAILGPNTSGNRIISKALSGSPQDWSVICAGALLTQLGASVEFPKEKRESGARTPDILASWNSDVVDVTPDRRKSLSKKNFKA